MSGSVKESFEKWRALETKSINLFLLSTWGQALVRVVIVVVFHYFISPIENEERVVNGLIGIFSLLGVIGIVVSAFIGTKASKLKKAYEQELAQSRNINAI